MCVMCYKKLNMLTSQNKIITDSKLLLDQNKLTYTLGLLLSRMALIIKLLFYYV